MKNIKKVLLCIGLFLSFCVLLVFRKSEYATNIASNANDVVELKSGSVLTQTWLSNKKEICGIKIAFAEIPATDVTVNLEISSPENEEIKRTGQRKISEIEDEILVISFDTLTLPTATEVEISIWLSEGEDASVFFKTNNNYNGLYIDGEPYNCGLSSQIIYTKNQPLFVMLAIFGEFCILAYNAMLFFKRKFSDVIGMVVLAVGIILYLCGLIHNVEIGMKILNGLSILGYVHILYNVLIEKIKIKEMISWGAVGVALIYLLSILYNYNTIILESDEYSHWALAAKDMFYSNMLSSHEGTTVSNIRYPPFMALMQYFFMYINGGFSEKFLFIAYQFSGFCLLITWLKEEERTCAFSKIVIILLTAIFPLITFPRYYNTIMIDGFLGMLFAYVLYCYFFEELSHFNILRISVGLIALVLTKEMGFVMAGIACAIFIICEFKENRIKRLRSIIAIVTMGITTLSFFLSWQLYYYLNKANTVGKALIASTIIEHSFSEYENDGLFVIKVILSGLTQIFDVIKVGPFSIIVFLCAIIFIGYLVDACNHYKSFGFRMLCLSAGCILYFCILIFLYITMFTEEEALQTASLDRYMFSYLCGMIYLLICLFINREMNQKVEFLTLGITVCTVLHITSFTDVLMPNQLVEKKQTLIWGYDAIEENFHSFIKKEDKIFYWCDDTTQMSYRIFHFFVSPMRTQNADEGWSFSYRDVVQDKNVFYDIEEIKQILLDYDYVFLANYNEGVQDVYMQLFAEPQHFKAGEIFRIEKNGEEMKLVKVGYSPIKRVY